LIYDFLTETRTSHRQAQRLLQQQAKIREQARRRQAQKRLRFGLSALILAVIMLFTNLGPWMDSIPLEVWLLSFTGIGLLYFRR